MNFQIKLKRLPIIKAKATFGLLTLADFNCVTLELPWKDNKRDISCIPTGEYPLAERKYFAKGYQAIHVKDVPDRGHILMHIGNSLDDTRGCILVASQIDYETEYVYKSKIAFNKLMEAYYVFKPKTIKIIDL